MKKTKIIAVVLASVLILGAIIGGTFAYLTDTEGKINVMTVGNVDISLYEQQRNEDGSALVDFEQGKLLLPIVGSVQGADAQDRWGMPMAANFMDKIVTVENVGKNDAYVRVLVAMPMALQDLKGDGDANTSDNALHLSLGNRVDLEGDYDKTVNWTETWGWDYTNGVEYFKDIEIDGELYSVDAFTLPTKLAKGEITDAVIAGVYLDSKVDYDNDLGVWTMDGKVIDYDLSEGVKIPVFAQAVQADGFATAKDAFTASFGAIDVNNPWADTVVVNTETELKEAIATGKDVNLIADIELTANLVISNNVSIYGNGHKITGDFVVQVSSAADAVLIKNVVFDNAKGTSQSALVAGGYSGTLSIIDCTFNGTGWDCVQITPADGARIIVKDNTFKAAENGMGQKRYLHVQATKGEGADVKVTVTGNVFESAQYLGDSAVDIDYVAKKGITVGGNKVADDFAADDIYICSVNDETVMYDDVIADFTK